MASGYVAGTRLTLSATFTDQTGAPTDPTAVYLRVKKTSNSSSGDVIRYTYGDGHLLRDGVGAYHFAGGYLLDTPGTLFIEWGSSAGGQESLIQKQITVLKPLF